MVVGFLERLNKEGLLVVFQLHFGEQLAQEFFFYFLIMFNGCFWFPKKVVGSI